MRTLFNLGHVVTTPGAQRAMEKAKQSPLGLLARHVSGDWGDIDPEDKKENERSLKRGYRLMSVYKLTPAITVWIITEADRSVTTFLLPEDY